MSEILSNYNIYSQKCVEHDDKKRGIRKNTQF